LKRYFGTDGMRGAFGAEPLVETTVRALGAALGRRAKAAGNSDVVAVGDTRESTAPLARWMAQGMRDAGARLVWGGALPTGAAAFAAPARGSAFALAISASHNPHPDNGIKIIGADGAKLPDAVEADLEHELSTAHTSRDAQEPISLTVDTTIGAAYQATLLGTLDGEAPLSGLRLILERRRHDRRSRDLSARRRPSRNDRRPARRAQHQPRLRLDPSGGAGPRGSRARCRSRSRLRRRRRPGDRGGRNRRGARR
jgi:phosphomannomutase